MGKQTKNQFDKNIHCNELSHKRKRHDKHVSKLI